MKKVGVSRRRCAGALDVLAHPRLRRRERGLVARSLGGK
jgi:hypothetical protein